MMKIVRSWRLFAFLMLVSITHAYAAVDVNASTVYLKTSCVENGIALNNCFTDLATLNQWVFNVRSPAPSASSPVLVEIGPGQFNGQFVCSDSGYVTLRGSGMQATIINGASYPIALSNCINMNFMNMTVKGTGFGVQGGAGVSFWYGVELDVTGLYAWFDSANSCYGPKGKHYWFNSRIIGRGTMTGATAYNSNCDESWLFGTEIIMMAGNVAGGTMYAVKSTKARGDTHIYGGVVRVLSSSTSSATTLVAVQAENTGMVHVHGTGIDANATGANLVIALSAITSGEIHANQSAYNLSAASGATIKRVSKDSTAHIHAPYLWETHADVPFANMPGIIFESATGYDMAIVTAKPGGVTDHPHMVVYDASCGSKWFDMTLNLCR